MFVGFGSRLRRWWRARDLRFPRVQGWPPPGRPSVVSPESTGSGAGVVSPEGPDPNTADRFSCFLPGCRSSLPRGHCSLTRGQRLPVLRLSVRPGTEATSDRHLRPRAVLLVHVHERGVHAVRTERWVYVCAWVFACIRCLWSLHTVYLNMKWGRYDW